jgi:4-amino-4-deoxy-L-arabinose transferase-like glycosyltransferase
MPMTSIAAAASMAVFGSSRLAAELPMVLAGAALVPLTAVVGWELWRSRSVALVSGALAVFSGPMLVFVPLVDSFAIFGLGGCAAIYGSMRAVRELRGGRWLILAGVGVGVATLTRIDGIILAVAPAIAWLIRRGIGPWRVDLPPLSWRLAVACAGITTVILLPWLVRQQLVYGTPLPSAGGHTLWITSFNEQFSIGHTVDLGTYLASGAPAIIGSKLESWGLLVGRTAVLLGGVFLFSFAYGAWRERRRADLAPFLVYWLVLFLAMGGLFTLHAPFGAWYHSAWAWLPFVIPLAVGAFIPGTTALARWLPMLGRRRNQRFLLGAAVVGAIVLSIISSATLMAGWAADASRLATASRFLERQASQSDVVMHVNAPAISLATGLRAVAPPFDPYPVIQEVVRAYDVTWVVVERPPGAGSDPLGLWTGTSAVDVEGNRATFLSSEPAFDSADVRVYRTVPADE